MLPAMTWLWGGLAPAMACVLVSLMIYNHDGDPLNPKPMVDMILSSNQSEASYVAEDSHTAQNHLAAVTFDSTNRSGIQSIIGFTPNTNFSN